MICRFYNFYQHRKMRQICGWKVKVFELHRIYLDIHFYGIFVTEISFTLNKFIVDWQVPQIIFSESIEYFLK